MGKRERWEELGFASYRDWRLFDAAEESGTRRSVQMCHHCRLHLVNLSQPSPQTAECQHPQRTTQGVVLALRCVVGGMASPVQVRNAYFSSVIDI